MKHLIKGLLAVVVLASVLGVGWWKYREFLTAGMKPTPGTQRLNEMESQGVPNFTTADLLGNQIVLSDFKDKVVIVNFWASWCEPCVEEFPSMVKLVNFFSGQVVMLAISADRKREDIDNFIKTYASSLPKDVIIVWDQDMSLARQFGTQVLPESFVLGKGLKLVRKVAGSEDWFAPGAVQLFQEILKGEGGGN